MEWFHPYLIPSKEVQAQLQRIHSMPELQKTSLSKKELECLRNQSNIGISRPIQLVPVHTLDQDGLIDTVHFGIRGLNNPKSQPSILKSLAEQSLYDPKKHKEGEELTVFPSVHWLKRYGDVTELKSAGIHVL